MKQKICPLFLVLLLYIPPLYAADYPPVVGVALSRAASFFKKEQYGKAAAILRETLGKEGGAHKEIYLMLGNCAMLQKNIPEAEKSYTAALALDDSDPALWLNLGKAQYELKHYAQAARSFQSAWEKQPQGRQQAELLYYSAGAWLMAKQSKKAIAAFDRLFAVSAAKEIKTEWRKQYIHALVADGQSKKALPLIKEMIASLSGSEKAQWQEILLAQYVDLAMYDQAEKLARTLTDQYPGEARWWKALCHIQLADGKTEAALTALIACSYLKPLSEKEQKLLADLYLETGVPIKAAPLYRQVLKKKYRKETLQRLVISLYRQDDTDNALAILKRYRKEAAQSATLLQLEGEIYYGKQEFAAAARAYGKAAAVNGRHQGQCWLMAGYAALRGEDLSGAKRYLRKAMEFTKQRKSAMGALKMVEAQLAAKEGGSG